ncbi:hypothetical protein WHR41_09518 [Cladosporium halotolerans]|uniref:Uncharacterized protein n=1 Tax=Cladosporium halotolerans TaxID=1052096 RepID=A0AB34KAB4_9PEZI
MASSSEDPSPVEIPSLPFMRQLTALEEEERAHALAELQISPASQGLKTYLKDLRTGCDHARWNVETFTEGVKTLANLCGPNRVEYYDMPLKGLNYPTTFTQLWNEAYPRYPITLWNQNVRRQCPAGWTNTLEDKDTRWVIRYIGDKPLSQGLNDFLRGPTTLDCGMFCQFVLWMAIRYLVGDDLFDASCEFGKGEFALTQAWDLPMESAGNLGNLLHPFYDLPLPGDVFSGLSHQKRIITKTLYNHPTYLSKHPGGMGQLQNVTQIDGSNYIFQPFAPSILSDIELDDMLLRSYNSCQDLADLEKLAAYNMRPSFVHEHFAPKSYGDLAQEVEKSYGHELSRAEWEDGHSEREHNAAGLCLVFNFERLQLCLSKAFDQHRSGLNVENILLEANRLKWESKRLIVDGLMARLLA